MSRKAGFTVIETLTALLLLLLVLEAVWGVTAATARSAGALADRSESLAAARAVGWILQEELEGVGAGADLTVPAGDSFSIRAYRGSAIVCAQPGPQEILVRWTGLRSPDQTKDSVSLVGRGGAWTTRALVSRSASRLECAPEAAGRVETWRLSEPVPSTAFVRFFERGSYHLSDDALRYRIGAGGRQPLTPQAVDRARSGMTAEPRGRLIVAVATLGARRGRNGPAWRRAFALPGTW